VPSGTPPLEDVSSSGAELSSVDSDTVKGDAAFDPDDLGDDVPSDLDLSASLGGAESNIVKGDEMWDGNPNDDDDFNFNFKLDKSDKAETTSGAAEPTSDKAEVGFKKKPKRRKKSSLILSAIARRESMSNHLGVYSGLPGPLTAEDSVARSLEGGAPSRGSRHVTPAWRAAVLSRAREILDGFESGGAWVADAAYRLALDHAIHGGGDDADVDARTYDHLLASLMEVPWGLQNSSEFLMKAAGRVAVSHPDVAFRLNEISAMLFREASTSRPTALLRVVDAALKRIKHVRLAQLGKLVSATADVRSPRLAGSVNFVRLALLTDRFVQNVMQDASVVRLKRGTVGFPTAYNSTYARLCASVFESVFGVLNREVGRL
jgi:hypothetical protein